jgi:hypothetical protein
MQLYVRLYFLFSPVRRKRLLLPLLLPPHLKNPPKQIGRPRTLRTRPSYFKLTFATALCLHRAHMLFCWFPTIWNKFIPADALIAVAPCLLCPHPRDDVPQLKQRMFQTESNVACNFQKQSMAQGQLSSKAEPGKGHM